jgi:hypothetical protein
MRPSSCTATTVTLITGCPSSCDFFAWIQCTRWPGPYDPHARFRSDIAGLSNVGPPLLEALLPAPVGVGHFVIRATRERGVGVPSSRSLATASREANSLYGRTIGVVPGTSNNRCRMRPRDAVWFNPNIAHQCLCRSEAVSEPQTEVRDLDGT